MFWSELNVDKPSVPKDETESIGELPSDSAPTPPLILFLRLLGLRFGLDRLIDKKREREREREREDI